VVVVVVALRRSASKGFTRRISGRTSLGEKNAKTSKPDTKKDEGQKPAEAGMSGPQEEG